jgi:hypothetical protein
MDELADDVPVRFDEPRLNLDPACPICLGSGVMEGEARRLECTCLLRQRVVHYLTPQYGCKIGWDDNFQTQPYLHKDVLIENTRKLPVGHFRQSAFAAIKAFLLLTGMQFSHRTVRPYDIFRQLFDTKDTQGFEDLSRRVQLLVLFIEGNDSRKNSYQQELPWLIRRRRDAGVFTWIVSAIPLGEKEFSKCYPNLLGPLLTCIQDGFVPLNLKPVSARDTFS